MGVGGLMSLHPTTGKYMRWKHITDVVQSGRDQIRSGDQLPAKIVTREKIERLTEVLRALPPAELKTKHYWINGIYVREMFLPAGTVAVGKIHKVEHVFMVTAGTVVLVHENGAPVTVEAPYIVTCAPGTRRAATALTDVTMIGVYRTDERDIEKAERELIVDDPGAALNHLNLPKVPLLK